jgi:diacylglycerol kinase family enzyme
VASSGLSCILNRSSGCHPGPELCEKLSRIFAEAGTPARIHLASSGAEIPELARRAVKENSQIIVAGGGDGTVNAVANELMGTSITLGVLPLGTLNHFSKDMQIPQDLEDAARNLITGRAVPVDVGEVNGRFFINNSSLGIYPHIVRLREEQQNRTGRKKWVAFVQALFSVLKHYSFLRVDLRVNGKQLSCETPLVFVGNNKYEMEGLNIGRRRRLDAGELCLFVTNGVRRGDLVRFAFLALVGRLHDARDFDVLITDQVSIDTRRPLANVSTDGEVIQVNTPLHYLTHPGALRVIVPVKTSRGPHLIHSK